MYLFRVLVIAAIALPMVASADVYRWVDKQGVAHYSDQPTDKADAVKINSAASGSVPDTQAGDAPTAADDTPQPVADADDAAARVRTEQCAQAKQRLTEYRNAERIVAKEGDGKQRELTPDEQVDAIVRAENRAEALCGGQPESGAGD